MFEIYMATIRLGCSGRCICWIPAAGAGAHVAPTSGSMSMRVRQTVSSSTLTVAGLTSRGSLVYDVMVIGTLETGERPCASAVLASVLLGVVS